MGSSGNPVDHNFHPLKENEPTGVLYKKRESFMSRLSLFNKPNCYFAANRVVIASQFTTFHQAAT